MTRCPVCRMDWSDPEQAEQCASLDREIAAVIEHRRAERKARP